MQRTISSESSLHNWTNVVKKNVSTSTVSRRRCEAGLYGRISGKKLLLKKQNNGKSLQWAKVNKDWTIEQWNKVLWTDESKFEIFGSNKRVYVYQRVGERAAILCITPTVKYGGGSVKVWRAFANCKVGDLYQMKTNWIRSACESRICTHAR